MIWLTREEQPGNSIPHVQDKGHDQFTHLVRIGCCYDAFTNALMNDFCQKRCRLLDRLCAYFLAEDGVIVGVQGVQQSQEKGLSCSFPTRECRIEALELFEGRQVSIMHNGEEKRFSLFPHAFNQRFQQGLF